MLAITLICDVTKSPESQSASRRVYSAYNASVTRPRASASWRQESFCPPPSALQFERLEFPNINSYYTGGRCNTACEASASHSEAVCRQNVLNSNENTLMKFAARLTSKRFAYLAQIFSMHSYTRI